MSGYVPNPPKGYRYSGTEPVASQHQHEAVVPDRLHQHLDTVHLDASQQLDDLRGDLGRYTSRATVADEAAGIERAQVPTCGNVVGAQFEVDADRLQDASADVELVGVVAKQCEMSGATTRRDAETHRDCQAEIRHGRETVDVPGVCLLQLAALRLGPR